MVGDGPQVLSLLLVSQGPLEYQDPSQLSESEEQHGNHRLLQSQNIPAELSNLDFDAPGILLQDGSRHSGKIEEQETVAHVEADKADPYDNILRVFCPVFREVEWFGGVRANTARDRALDEVLLSQVDGRHDGVVEEEEDGGGDPEQFVVQLQVGASAHQTSLRIFDHQEPEGVPLITEPEPGSS